MIGFYKFGRWLLAAEVEKDFERGGPAPIEELEAERLVPIEMAGLAEGKDRIQFPTADVHIKRFGTDVQKAVALREITKLAKGFDGSGSI
jgi:hypothetical protein